jgi:uncharacterized protein
VTRESRKKNIAVEIARGDDSLDSARILLQAGKHADAVSRAYYAVFHYARALLLTEGTEVKTHGGVERILQRDFVATGKLDPKVARLFSTLQKFRQDADYTAEYVFTAEAAAEDIGSAETFIGAVRATLGGGAWI